MKGIYLTEQGKQEIESKIAELEEDIREEMNPFIHTATSEQLNVYNKILSSATILPVEKSWGNMPIGLNESELSYPQGVIIQPKS
jgi:hypothetical protein